MKFSFRLLFLLLFTPFIVSLLYTCANKVPPSGGPSDTIPPTLVYSNPKRQATNVHSRVYEFRFDEKIKLENLNRTLIITPRIDFDYEVKASKKSFILVFDENFNENTTYTFNFRDAVQDITEGNEMKDNHFTFSTGTYIDSLSIEGHAIHLLTKDTIKEATIGLYRAGDTTTILNGSPYYFAQTDEKGYYKITNIKNGKYNLYGFVDQNTNLMLETKNEAYAFTGDTIDLQYNIDSLNLYFLNHDIREFSIVTALPSGQNFDINFNKYIVSYDLEPLSDTLRIYSNKVKEHRSIRIYNTFFNPDSTGIKLKAVDSTRNTLEDTIWVKFNESRRKPDEFAFKIKPPTNQSITQNFIATLNFNKPIALVDSDSIFFRVDTIPVATINSRTQILANKHLTTFQLKFKLNKPYIDSLSLLMDSIRTQQALAPQDTVPEPENEPQVAVKKTIKQASQQNTVSFKGLHLYLGKTSFISVENDSLPVQALNYQFLDPKMVGNLSGTVTSDENFILQLLSDRGEVVRELYSTSNFQFSNVQPGNYKLRILVDLNKNGIWDYGNLLEGRTPEPVVYHQTDDGKYIISVRANWDITDLAIQY